MYVAARAVCHTPVYMRQSNGVSRVTRVLHRCGWVGKEKREGVPRVLFLKGRVAAPPVALSI